MLCGVAAVRRRRGGRVRRAPRAGLQRVVRGRIAVDSIFLGQGLVTVTSKPTTAALAIVPTDPGRVVFVRQQRGPYAGWLLLPGGKLEFGESAEDAARRETEEEAGFKVGVLTPTGVYEIRAADGSYHFVMFAFRAGTAARVAAGGHHVDGVMESPVHDVRPHPTVMQILNDAGVAQYPPQEIEEGLRRDGILMRGFPIGVAATVG
jgi:8-oxo-dGTP diphosphatase